MQASVRPIVLVCPCPLLVNLTQLTHPTPPLLMSFNCRLWALTWAVDVTGEVIYRLRAISTTSRPLSACQCAQSAPNGTSSAAIFRQVQNMNGQMNGHGRAGCLTASLTRLKAIELPRFALQFHLLTTFFLPLSKRALLINLEQRCGL